MSYTKFVTSVSLVCCLTGFYLVGNAVHANEPELYFYPEQKWSVKRLNPDDNSHPICTISNQLNNGYIVEMSGSADGFSAINIDFRQNAFQQGSKYEMKFLVPGVSRIVVPSKAVKQSMVASDLTGHLDFAKELSNAGVMDIQIRDNDFRLYLTGLKAKMPVYNECTSTSRNDSIALNNDSNNSSGSPMPSNDLLNSSASSSDLGEYTPAQPKTVAGVAPPPPPVAFPVKDAPDTLAMDSASKARPNASGEPRYIDVLAKKLKRESKNYQPIDNSNNSSDPASAKSTDNSLNNSKASAGAAPVKTSHITRENMKSPKSVQTITRNETPIVMDFTDSAKPSNDRLASANNVATRLSKIEPASNAASGKPAKFDGAGFVDMRNKISSLESQIKLLTDKNSMLDEELKISLKDAEEERVSVSSDNWNLERATMRYNEAERQIQRIGRQLQTQRSQCEIEKTDLENMLFDPKLTSQQQLAKLSSMEAELDRTTSDMRRQQRQYEERIKLLEQQLGAQ